MVLKKYTKPWFFLFGLLLLAAAPGLPVTDQQGIDFWVGFPADSTPIVSPDILQLYITNITGGASGNVDIPGQGFSTSFTVPAGGAATVTLPANALVTIGDGVTGQGIHVTSDNPIAVYGIDYTRFSTDGYLALPTVADGTSYYNLTYSSVVTIALGGSFLVVGTQNATSVTITPPITVGSRTAGVPYTVTLNQGETYQLLDPTPGNDLTGAKIDADLPIAVFGAVQIAQIPTTVLSGNFLVEQMWPVQDWGSDFAVFPMALPLTSPTTPIQGNFYRYMASVDGTTVSVNGAAVATLNAGQFFEQVLKTPSEITADNPIYVMEYAPSALFAQNIVSDPSMMTIVPVDRFTNQYLVPTDFNHNALIPLNDYYNIVVPAPSVGTVLLDGVAVPASSYFPIGTGTYYGAAVSILESSHLLTGPVPFGVQAYRFDGFDAYSFPAGGLFESAALPLTPTPTPTGSITPTPTVTSTHTLTQTLTSTLTPTGTITPLPPTLTPTPIVSPVCVTRVWPDPFNANYAVGGTLKVDCVPAGAVLSFYTVSGEMVRTITALGGLAEWDGRNESGVPVSPGVYYYVVQQGQTVVGKGKFLVFR